MTNTTTSTLIRQYDKVYIISTQLAFTDSIIVIWHTHHIL